MQCLGIVGGQEMQAVTMSACVRAQLCLTLRPHELQPTRFLCPSNFLGKNTRVGCHSLLQGIFPAQESNLGRPRLRAWEGGFFTRATWEALCTGVPHFTVLCCLYFTDLHAVQIEA